jgi:predicted transcriptional regulator of viral defense system
MGDQSCNISGVMARPATARNLLYGYLDSLDEHDRGQASSAFDLSLDGPELARFASARGQHPPDVESLLRRMVAKGEAHRLQAGRYLVNRPGLLSPRPRLDDLEPVAELVLRRLDHRYYLSWHTGLWHHGLIEQQSRTVLCAVRIRKRPVRLGAQTVRFVSVTQRKFFGFSRSDSYQAPVWVADLEKTLLDSLDAPALVGPMSVVIAALDQAARQGVLDPQRLVAYAIRMGGPVLNRRLGYFMERLSIPGAADLEAHLGRKSAVALAPGRAPSPGAKVDPRWRVYSDEALVSSAKELK